jgi:hypothetical protein
MQAQTMKKKEVILSGAALRAAVFLAEQSATKAFVKNDLIKGLGMDEIFTRDLSEQNPAPFVRPTHPEHKESS